RDHGAEPPSGDRTHPRRDRPQRSRSRRPSRPATPAPGSRRMSHFKPGCIYPLKHPERFDDEAYGVGYDHVAVPEGCDPGDCYIIDMWPVNAKGEVHPGYNASPVPVRAADVDLANGRPLKVRLPK